jgi:hypothetical protein
MELKRFSKIMTKWWRYKFQGAGIESKGRERKIRASVSVASAKSALSIPRFANGTVFVAVNIEYVTNNSMHILKKRM